MLLTNQALMIQGTTSDAGKSILTAGLGRVLARKGVKVAPFKPQNMALNSAVTKDGGEIGRAQALQAQACYVEPTVHMNPVLLKPNTDIAAQVIVQGKAVNNMETLGTHHYKSQVMGPIMESFQRLQQQYQTVLVEGAGSPAEINLRAHDVANMGFAEEADIPVIIVADIDRGGVFAHLYGTLALLSETEQARVKGFIINRFRGDMKLLEPGLEWLEQATGKPVLGVLPYLHGLTLDAEDGINTQQVESTQKQLQIVIPVLPRMSNHTDFDPLRIHPQVNLQYVCKGSQLPPADLIILPGTKNVRSDLAFLREQGWERQISRHVRLGGKLMGVCGGYQMLGQTINDPDGIEGEAGSSSGLGYLPIHTELAKIKQLTQTHGVLKLPEQAPAAISGYQIHAGVSCHSQEHAPIHWQDGYDGHLGQDNQVMGTYLHGLFDRAEACSTLLSWAGLDSAQAIDLNDIREKNLDRLADTIEQHVNLKALWPEWQNIFRHTINA